MLNGPFFNYFLQNMDMLSQHVHIWQVQAHILANYFYILFHLPVFLVFVIEVCIRLQLNQVWLSYSFSSLIKLKPTSSSTLFFGIFKLDFSRKFHTWIMLETWLKFEQIKYSLEYLVQLESAMFSKISDFAK